MLVQLPYIMFAIYLGSFDRSSSCTICLRLSRKWIQLTLALFKYQDKEHAYLDTEIGHHLYGLRLVYFTLAHSKDRGQWSGNILQFLTDRANITIAN